MAESFLHCVVKTWMASGCGTALGCISSHHGSTARLGTHDDQHAWAVYGQEQTNGGLEKTKRDYVQRRGEQRPMDATEQVHTMKGHARGKGACSWGGMAFGWPGGGSWRSVGKSHWDHIHDGSRAGCHNEMVGWSHGMGTVRRVLALVRHRTSMGHGVDAKEPGLDRDVSWVMMEVCGAWTLKESMWLRCAWCEEPLNSDGLCPRTRPMPWIAWLAGVPPCHCRCDPPHGTMMEGCAWQSRRHH